MVKFTADVVTSRLLRLSLLKTNKLCEGKRNQACLTAATEKPR